MNFEQEITKIAGSVPEGYELAPETAPLAAEALEDIDNRYGERSNHPLAYHNASHSVEVTRRAVRLTKLLSPYINQKHEASIYDLAILSSVNHDYEQEQGPGGNEASSVRYALGCVEAAGGSLNTKAFKERLSQGILSTTVEMRENGDLVQINLQSGESDPLKFIMAFSDINGIAMEGSKRMLRDAANLYHEITEEPTADGLVDFMVDEARFLRQRLNDRRIKSDISYYFPENADDVYKDMRKAYHGNIISAYKLALLLGDHPELQKSASIVAKSINALDSKMMGAAISRLLRHKIASR